jgi:hypothetical protein
VSFYLYSIQFKALPALVLFAEKSGCSEVADLARSAIEKTRFLVRSDPKVDRLQLMVTNRREARIIEQFKQRPA